MMDLWLFSELKLRTKFDTIDVLKIETINNLKITIANAIKQITQTEDN